MSLNGAGSQTCKSYGIDEEKQSTALGYLCQSYICWMLAPFKLLTARIPVIVGGPSCGIPSESRHRLPILWICDQCWLWDSPFKGIFIRIGYYNPIDEGTTPSIPPINRLIEGATVLWRSPHLLLCWPDKAPFLVVSVTDIEAHHCLAPFSWSAMPGTDTTECVLIGALGTIHMHRMLSLRTFWFKIHKRHVGLSSVYGY